jgi:hypothetical protein
MAVPGAVEANETVNTATEAAHENKEDQNIDERPRWIIVARHAPLWVYKGKDISTIPLQKVIWCLVSNPRTLAWEYKLLQVCQTESLLGQAIYDDVDRGLGVHPASDREWLDALPYKRDPHKRKLSPEDYVVRGAALRHIGHNKHITVIFDILNNDFNPLLHRIRNDHEHRLHQPVRAPLGKFVRIGGDLSRVLKSLKQQSNLYVQSGILKEYNVRHCKSPRTCRSTRKGTRQSDCSITFGHSKVSKNHDCVSPYSIRLELQGNYRVTVNHTG